MNRRLDVLLQKPSGLIPKPKQPQELKNIAGEDTGIQVQSFEINAEMEMDLTGPEGDKKRDQPKHE
jgi:hypothetical protein